MRAHLEMETAEYIRRGMAPEEARRQALLASGGLTLAAESVRDQRGLPWAEHPVHVLYTDYSKAKGQSLINSVNILVDTLLK